MFDRKFKKSDNVCLFWREFFLSYTNLKTAYVGTFCPSTSPAGKVSLTQLASKESQRN